MKDKRNNTYKSDKAFLKDKDSILNILSKDINLQIYDEYTIDNKIILILKSDYLDRHLISLSSYVCSNPIYDFQVDFSLPESINKKITNTIFELDGIEEIDKDIYSSYYPICFETKIKSIWISLNPYQGEDITNLITLLTSYSREYFYDNPLVKSLIYSVIA